MDIVERLRGQRNNLNRDILNEAIAEIERQQADIDKLLAERQEWLDEIERLRAAQSALQTEINRMGGGLLVQHADNERLRAALQEVSDLCKTSPTDPFLADNMDRSARRALEPKP